MSESAAGARDLLVGFLYVGPLSRIAQIMVASVRATMPHARIIQMTDYSTKPVTGVDEVMRKRWDQKTLMTYRFEQLKEFPQGNAVFLDADVVVRKDLSPVFDDEFDVALTFRDDSDPSLRLTPEAYETMPFNTGVMFSSPSGREFWADAHRLCLGMSHGHQCWFGDQLAVKELAATTRLRVKQYPCALFNYSPARVDEDLSEKFVIHYKGENRKLWMMEQWGHLLPQRR